MQGVFPQIRNVVKRPVSMPVVPEVPPDPQPVAAPGAAGIPLTSTPVVSVGNTADAGSHTGTQTESYAAAKRGKVTRLGAFQNVDWTDLREGEERGEYWPPVRFRINEHLFFVNGSTYEGPPVTCMDYYWIVRYVESPEGGIMCGIPAENLVTRENDTDRAHVAAWRKRKVGHPPAADVHVRENVHFLAPVEDRTVKIGQYYLTKLLREAEAADYQFALRMQVCFSVLLVCFMMLSDVNCGVPQGLQNSTLNAVWVCTDPDYVSEQRSSMMDLFMKQYVSRLYGKRGTVIEGSQPSPEEVIKEAINLHEKVSVMWFVLCDIRTY